MHRAAAAKTKPTDSMRMFLEGLQGGRPSTGKPSYEPEWFYKGDGGQLVGPGEALSMPHFAEGGGEAPELADVYLIGPDRRPYRLGLCLANEFSDHVVERRNDLWLAHSKLRQASLGPELLLSDPPQDVRGVSRIRRDGEVLWENARQARSGLHP